MRSQLRDQIVLYLEGRSSLQELEERLLSHLQQILDSGDEAAIEIANKVDADLVELGEGLTDQVTLQWRLQSYLRGAETIQVTFPETRSVVATYHGTTSVQTVSVRQVSGRPVSA